MNNQLRVLMLEDNPGDAELNELQLLRAGFDVLYHRVETRQDYLNALEEFKPDIVLADYRLPQFDGLTALRLTHERFPFIPFIIVSGVLEEETAVALLQSGAADYVLKGNLVRLGPAVRNAFEIKRAKEEKARMEDALRVSYVQLEQRVKERTSELEQLNQKLQQEIEERKQIEAALQESRTELKEDLADTRLLQSISAELLSEENTRALYEKIINAAAQIMRSEYASLQMYYPDDDEGGRLRLLVFHGFNPQAARFWEWVKADTSRSTCGQALRTKQRVIVSNVEKCDFMKNTEDQAMYLQTGIRASQTTPLFSRDGSLVGMLSTHWSRPHQPSERDLRMLDILARQAADLIERAQTDEELRAANAQLREADKRKNEFMGMLSHELRNPLTPIKNSLFILDRVTPGSEQAQRAQAVIERQVNQLTRLVDDLLDVTRITRNLIQLQCEHLELNELLRHTLEDYRSQFERARIQLAFEPAPSLVFVNADRNRLAQVIGNLLDNAAKFTPAGGDVKVSVSTISETKQAVIRVADTGKGLTPEIMARLFEPFMQADTTLARGRGGLGLGLALVKGLVDLHGGKVTASSTGAGQGSQFTIYLPLDFAPSSAQKLEQIPSGKVPRRVLIIEDNIDAADSLSELLTMDGHIVAVTHNGLDGINKAHEFKPDIVLCDIGLPGIDGYAVARAFRADEGLKDIYLVALSGYTLPEDRQHASEAGFNQHLGKPPNLKKLAKILDSLPAR